ncbi:unnamed protein product, partial [Rotaria magnacalcarata]
FTPLYTHILKPTTTETKKRKSMPMTDTSNQEIDSSLLSNGDSEETQSTTLSNRRSQRRRTVRYKFILLSYTSFSLLL